MKSVPIRSLHGSSEVEKVKAAKCMGRDSQEIDFRETVREGQLRRAVLLDSLKHELRTPIASIKISVSALLSESQLSPGQRKELLVVIEEEADRLNRLIGEAVQMAELDHAADVIELHLKPEMIAEIVDAAMKDCRSELLGRSISLHIQSNLPAVRADLNRMRKVLVNLIENAIKYSPAHEPISITSELRGRYVITSITDRGGGIDDSEKTLIFRKFYRGRCHRNSIQGTGMGLAIAKAIVEAHGGSLTVANRNGQGSTFSFTLPVEQLRKQRWPAEII